MSREGPLVRLAATLDDICYAAILNKGPRDFDKIYVGQKLSPYLRLYSPSMLNLLQQGLQIADVL